MVETIVFSGMVEVVFSLVKSDRFVVRPNITIMVDWA